MKKITLFLSGAIFGAGIIMIAGGTYFLGASFIGTGIITGMLFSRMIRTKY